MENSFTNVQVEFVDSTNTTWAQKDTDNIANRDLVQSMFDVLLQNKEILVTPTSLSIFNDVQTLPSFQYEASTTATLNGFLHRLLASQVRA